MTGILRTWGAVACTVVLCSTLMGGIFPGTVQPATAQEEMAQPTSAVEELISSIEKFSHETSARNEEVKALELEIAKREEDIALVQSQIEEFRTDADDAVASADGFRAEINRIAQAKYRGTVTDPLTVAVSAENPQNAIDRMSYMSTLTKSTSDVAQALKEKTTKAAELVYEANRMKVEADFQLGELKARLSDLDKEQELLNLQKSEIRQRVDSLSPEERVLWESKNSPLDVNVLASLGISAAADGATGAVSAALSKIGSPYGWGAVGPQEFDCSGLIFWAYQQMGKSLPRTSQAQMAGGTPVERDQLLPGDVIGYYPGATHVGLYIGDGMIVHASDYGIPVQVVSVDSAPFYGARRY